MDELAACQVCGNSQGNLTHQVREMMFGTGEIFTYLECAACHTLQLLDVPEDMGGYYPSGYYSLGGLNTTPPVKRYGLERKGSGFSFLLVGIF